MIKKKAKSKVAARPTKTAAKKADKKRVRKPKDPAQVRQEIAGMVKSGAKGITKAVMSHAMNGELAPAKYLLEMAGVYPPVTDGSLATKDEESLAETLLHRLDLPDTPVVQDDEDEVVAVAKPAKAASEEEEAGAGGSSNEAKSGVKDAAESKATA